MTLLLHTDGADRTRPEPKVELAKLSSGQDIIGLSDGTNWHFPSLVLLQGGSGQQQGVGFMPLLFLFENKTVMPRPNPDAVLHIGDPDPGLARAFQSNVTKQRAAASGLVSAGSITDALAGLQVHGGRR